MAAKRWAVVGAGIIGAAVAREVLMRHDSVDVTVFEKEDRPAVHQTGHNSGVVHAGLYYEPGSLKARLCRRGVSLLLDFADEHDVAVDECGKVVVATDEVEAERLGAIHDRGRANGVPDLAMLDRDGLRGIEPHAEGVAALHSPHTAIIDYPGLTEALIADVRSRGGRIRLSTPVKDIRRMGRTGGSDTALVRTPVDAQEFDAVIVCAGLHSDRLAARSGEGRTPPIVPFFGQCFILEPGCDDIVNGLIYPVPDPKYPFLGVHVTRRIDAGPLIGPKAFLSLSREGCRGPGLNLPASISVASGLGLRRFASQ